MTKCGNFAESALGTGAPDRWPRTRRQAINLQCARQWLAHP